MDRTLIAGRITSLRKEAGITQVEMGTMLGLGKSTIGMYESGKRIPTDDIKMKIADLFGKTVNDIFYAM